MLAADVAVPYQVELETASFHLPDIPMLVRVELRDAAGDIARDVFEAEALLKTDPPGVTLSDDRIQLRNGVGSVLTTVDGSGSFTLSVTVDGQTVTRAVASPPTGPIQELSGELTESVTRVSGIVHVRDGLTIPPGRRLELAPGTLLLVDGRPRSDGLGDSILVQGELVSAGTAESPVVITAENVDRPWGEIDIQGGRAQLEHTMIHRAGNAPRGGHTGTGPALRLRSDGTLVLRESSVTDIAGKIMQASSGDAIIVDSLLSRAVMGPEVDNTGLLFQDSWIIDMAGRFHHNGTVDDNDGIYLHSQAPGQQVVLRGGVVAGVQDDGIDTLGADAIIEDFIVTDAADKGVSVFDGDVTLRRVLLTDAEIGIETKGAGRSRPHTTLDRVSIANVNQGIVARDKGTPDPNVVITYDVTNTIVQVSAGGIAVRTDYRPEDLHINYSLLPNPWDVGGSGQGNIVGDPLFVAPADNDFHLRPDSPAIDSGDPQAPPDPDGSRADMGFYPLDQRPVGDVNSDRSLSADDIDALCQRVATGPKEARLDLDRDGRLDAADVDWLIQQVLHSTRGDANLDGVFNSDDLLAVFQAGEFEDSIANNSTWADGDWNCDGEFTTADLLRAFQAGGYQG